jgi:Uma2 family endonuclease
MSTAEKKGMVSIAEYLEYGASIEGKAEYYDGEIFDMAGAAPDHNLIAINLGGSLVAPLRGSSCKVYSSDQRIFIPEEGSFVYPDLSVICGEREYAAFDPNSILNPRLVVEVVSPSSAAFDRSGKFQRYATLPSLMEYVIVEQSTLLVHVFLRAADGKWLMSSYHDLDQSVRLESIDVSIPMAYIYDGVAFSG